MDWDEIIDRQLSGLKRILAMLVAMASMGAGGTTLRRRAYYGVLRLLRPAESAARRLVIIAARDLVVALPPRRPVRPRPKRRSIYVRPGGTGIVVPYGTPMPDARPPRQTLGFRLFDPPYRIVLRRSPPRTSVPRIAFFGWEGPSRSPGPAPRSDTVDTTRLNLRIAASAVPWRICRNRRSASHAGRPAGPRAGSPGAGRSGAVLSRDAPRAGHAAERRNGRDPRRYGLFREDGVERRHVLNAPAGRTSQTR
jgi:hypothetical protein